MASGWVNGEGTGGLQRSDKPLSATDEDEQPRDKDNVQSLCVSGCAALPAMIALMLLSSRLDGGPLATQSLAVSGASRSCLACLLVCAATCQGHGG